MHKSIIVLMLLMVSTSLLSGISVVRKGSWTPICSGVWISQHNRYDKALEAVINHGEDCDIKPPSRFEIRFDSEPEPITETKDLEISWSTPTRREDDTEITSIDRFNLYFAFNGGIQNIIQVEADTNLYTLANVAAGSYNIQVSTVSNGVEGKPSAPITIQVN